MQQRYKIVFEYAGDCFYGSQRQIESRQTVQGLLEMALEMFVRGSSRSPPGKSQSAVDSSSSNIAVTLAGRTDAGVHATGMAAHFDLLRMDRKTNSPAAEAYSAQTVLKALQANIQKILQPGSLAAAAAAAAAASKGGMPSPPPRSTVGSLIIRSCEAVAPTFHARHWAMKRTYVYLLRCRIRSERRDDNGAALLSPESTAYNDSWQTVSSFEAGKVWAVPGSNPLNLQAMQQAATAVFVGIHDFTSFRHQACTAKSPVRHMETVDVVAAATAADAADADAAADATVEPRFVDPRGSASSDQQTGLVSIRFVSRSFLYHQIRNMVAALVLVGQGKLSMEDLRRIRDAKDRSLAPAMAPPDGLYLIDVCYPAEASEQQQEEEDEEQQQRKIASSPLLGTKRPRDSSLNRVRTASRANDSDGSAL